ncbi:sigma factor-like helix-turn-helix DNA-binding protein [Micromonospora sp. NPDC004551]|uniref:sigma factor-like helix-turn-helix DNA-binding protein n=1 Tax=Micromonospora sp. NPDC004551 TaxID=3154284 RepID=UPI0033A0B29C
MTVTSAALGDLPPEAYHDAPWTRLLPWLAPYTPATARELTDLTPSPDWWLTESPALTTMTAEHEALCRHLARLFVVRHPTAAFGPSFPSVPRQLPLSTIATSSRVGTAFQRLQVQTVADLGQLSVRDLYDVRGTGQGTVEDAVTALVSAAIVRSGELVEWEHAGEDLESDAATPEVQLPPAQLQLLEDLSQLASWHHIRRRGKEPLLKVFIEDGVPEQIQEVALRLNSLTAADISAESGSADPVLEFTALLSELDDRQVRILRDRFLGRPPKTLAELASEFKVTRERVRQVEGKLKELLGRTFHFGTGIGNLLASLRTEIQPIAALDRLITLHPDLARDVPGVDAPLWLVLDRLDDYFEVTDGWAAAPDVTAAREQTRILLEDFATEHGLVDLAAVTASTAMPKAELVAWLSWCGYVLHNDQILTRTRSLNDHAAGLLAATGEPLKTEELHQEMGRETTIRSLANALAADDRFIRTDRSTWGLASWDVEEYTSIKQQIGLELAAAGGHIEISRLVESITSRFNVSPSSVQAYAGNGDYEIVDGVVRRREAPAAPRKAPSATRRLFRHGDVWKFRITVTRDHLRGSGFPLPSGVASLVGCNQGDVVELDSELGTQTIRWTGLQPASGTIKRFLDQMRAWEGRTAFLEFRPYGRFGLTLNQPLDPGAHPLVQALALVGAERVSDAEAAKATLAAAVDLPPDAKPRRILATYRQRGDDDVSALLEQVWTRQRHPWTGQEVGVDGQAETATSQTGLPRQVQDSTTNRADDVDDLGVEDGAVRDPAPTAQLEPEEEQSSSWLPVPAGFRSAGWIRPHEAEAAVLAYQLHTDVPVQDGDELAGWARYVDEDSKNVSEYPANVMLVRTRARGEKNVGWIRELEAFGITQACAEGRAVTVTGLNGETLGLVEYHTPGSEAAERFRSPTRLLRVNSPHTS